MYKDIKIYAIVEGLEGQDKEKYKYKIKKYKNECGCSMGGIFSILSMLFFIFYTFFIFKNLSLFEVLKVVIGSIAITIIAGLIGKIIGILLARIRLLLLYRFLIQHFKVKY